MTLNQLLRVSLIGMTCSFGTYHFTHAETSIFSSSTASQKQWVGQAAPDFKLQDQNAALKKPTSLKHCIHSS
jgi:peroxiredoxin Q/BCP